LTSPDLFHARIVESPTTHAKIMETVQIPPSTHTTEGTQALRQRLIDSNDPDQPYEPALHAVHSHSNGYVYRTPSIKTTRIHHLLSRLEWHAFLFFDFGNYTNIREQFAVPLELTLPLAKQMGIRHPYDWKKRRLVEMTSDFVLNNPDGTYVAVDVKPSEKLTNKRTAQKLDLINRAWAMVGVPHLIVTEKQQNPVVVANYRILHGLALRFEPTPFPQADMAKVNAALFQALHSGHLTLREAAAICERQAGLGRGRSIRSALWFIANHHWSVDITRPIGPDETLTFHA
jgi:hypothetical protein